MLNDKKIVPFAVAAIVLAVGFIVWKFMDVSGPDDTPVNAGGQTPPLPKDAQNFGHLPDEHLIGKGFSPAGGTGGGPMAVGKGGR